MTTQAMVSVYGVEDVTGDTGACLGVGSLVTAQLVLVHQTFGEGVKAWASTSRRLRVGIFYPTESGHLGEVIDTCGVNLADGSIVTGAEPLAVIQLSRPATGPVVPLIPGTAPVPNPQQLAKAAQRRVADSPPVPQPALIVTTTRSLPALLTHTEQVGDSVWCKLFHVGCPKGKGHASAGAVTSGDARA
jgi:hypothetical protein